MLLLLVEDGAALDPLGGRRGEGHVAHDAYAAAEGPVALDGERVGLAQRRGAVGEALVEVADQLVEVAVERDVRAPRRRPGRARSPCRGRRRRSAARAGRRWSSPARSGRGRPRWCARPRTPRSRRPSRSRSGSPRGCDLSAGSRCLTLRISGRPRMPPRASSASRHRLRGRTTGCWSSRTGAGRGRPAPPGPASSVCADSRSTMRPSLLRRAKWPPLRSDGVRRTASIANGAPLCANQPATRASGTAPRLSELETKT